MANDRHSYTIVEPTRTPLEGLLLGYGAMLPIAAGALGVWVFSDESQDIVAFLTTTWAGAIVAFLAGVRRGLSFRAPDGATLPQLATMLWLFGLATLVLSVGPGPLASGILIVAFASVAVLDTMAARREEAPPYFAHLRPLQMGITVASLLALLVRQLA